MNPCQIITFYSYKGGVGRTMALANLAWVLASNGRRVLTVDWHLDAPGLHRYFGPFLEDRLLDETTGLIDFLVDYAEQVTRPQEAGETDWLNSAANILQYAVSLNWKFPGEGFIDFVSAGRQSGGYAASVNEFSWTTFYEKLGGSGFLDTVKRRMREEYDYVLIDSSPGIGQASGIATLRMPDSVVVCSNFTRQCIIGSAAVARAVMEQGRERQIRVFPALMRVNLAEKALLDLGRAIAWREFAPCLYHLRDPEAYKSEIEFLYTPFYEYVELLAAFVETSPSLGSLLAPVERLAFYLTGGTVKKNVPIPETQRTAGLNAFLSESAFPEGPPP